MWAMIPASKKNKKATALIEIAAASGLDLLPSEQSPPLTASSYGTGQLIKQLLTKVRKKSFLASEVVQQMMVAQVLLRH